MSKVSADRASVTRPMPAGPRGWSVLTPCIRESGYSPSGDSMLADVPHTTRIGPLGCSPAPPVDMRCDRSVSRNQSRRRRRSVRSGCGSAGRSRSRTPAGTRWPPPSRGQEEDLWDLLVAMAEEPTMRIGQGALVWAVHLATLASSSIRCLTTPGTQVGTGFVCWLQTPVSASTRPSLMATRNAAWSRSAWSA